MTGVSNKKHTDYTGVTLDDRYSVTRLLGKGGMGSVYLGKHLKIGKRVAVKFLHSEFSSSPSLVKRFYREAQAASRVEHGNIINVMDVGVSGQGEPYLVMEYLEGESLAEMLLRKAPLDLGAACGVLEPVLLALAAAHKQGIVHRDLKPDNIFLVHEDDGSIGLKLIDFGISKFVDTNNQSQLTQTGTMLGTPSYMSPEQVRGDKDVDHRADIYAVGVILYEMLTGKLPFGGGHFNELLVNVLTGEPTPPKEAYTDFPDEAESLVMRLLSRDPNGRPESALAALEEIRNLNGYTEKAEKLTMAAAGLTQKTFARGDLGTASDAVDDDRNVAAEIISELGGDTASDWSHTVHSRPFKRPLGIALIVLGGVAVFILAGYIWELVQGQEDQSSTIATTPPAQPALSTPPGNGNPREPAAPQNEKITIEIQQLPEKATVMIDGILMPTGSNPFKVSRGEKPIPLEIQAPGYETASFKVIPSQNQVIPSTLKPIEKANKAKDDGNTAGSGSKGSKTKGAKTGRKSPLKPQPKKPEPTPAVIDEYN